MKYLFIFTLTPVQSFISQARKTQDLYNGSKLLSCLIDEAINQLPDRKNLIYPHIDIKSKPNRFIAIIEKDNDEEIKKFGNDLKKYVESRFKEIAEDVFSRKALNNQKPQNFDNQIDRFFQTYWVAIPSTNYLDDYTKIEQFLGAVKNVRTFEQLKETGRKCSLCGERNIKIYRKNDNERDNQKLLEKKLFMPGDEVILIDKDDKTISHPFLLKGEGLCGICLSKRFYKKEGFPSTAGISLMHIIDKIEKNEIYKVYLNIYKTIFDDFYFDEQLYYEENLTEKYFAKRGLSKLLKECPLESIKEKQKKIVNIIEKNKLQLSSYYALIMFDGDNMGKWLSGINLKEEHKENLKDFHRDLSKKLGEFAIWAEDYLKEPKGKTVYTGGDDFLGFVNLQHLFSVMSDLRRKFDEIINKPLHNEGYYENDKNITFSAGIVIAHYKIPLSEVLKWVRNMEKSAKDIDDDKNAFAIAVLKHSGEIEKAIYKWHEDNDFILDKISNLTDCLRKDLFSNTFIKNLSIEFRKLMNKDGEFIGDALWIKAEIKRLIKRSCMIIKEDRKTKEQDIENLYLNVKGLYDDSKYLENFLSMLNIADFISREMSGDN